MEIPDLSLVEVPHLSADFWRTVVLRQRELRDPLGLTLTVAEVLQEGPPQRHFALISQTGILGCAIALPAGSGQVKIRQVAIAASHAGRGLGRFLMEGVEILLAREGPCRIIALHARVAVQGFYERLGYAAVGGTFEEIGIPHVRMEKPLPTRDSK